LGGEWPTDSGDALLRGDAHCAAGLVEEVEEAESGAAVAALLIAADDLEACKILA